MLSYYVIIHDVKLHFIVKIFRPSHLHVLGNEHLAGLLDHGLRLQLLGGELALAGVEHLLAGDAGQCQVSWVGLVAQWHLDGLRVNGAGGVAG